MAQTQQNKALLLLSLVCLNGLLTPCNAACGTSPAVVAALLPLHSGTNCDTLSLRGLQQLAALRAVVSEVNNDIKAQDGLSIGLQVQDTCSSPDGAMKAALRSLVEQQSCVNPPLFLGMVGPEDAESLAKVKGVSKVFNTTHIVPQLFHSQEPETAAEEDRIFHVTIERTKELAQSVLTMVKQLGWRSFSLTFEEPLAEAAEALLAQVKGDATICVKGHVNRLNPLGAVPNIFTGSADGVVVMADSHRMASRILKSYQSKTTPMVMLVRSAGLESWEIPRSATKMYLLQQVSVTQEEVPETLNATLKAQYEAQKQAEFQNVHCNDLANAADCAMESSEQDSLTDALDVSVTPLANAVRLVGSALKAVHRARCQAGAQASFGMCARLQALPAHEWHVALRRASTVTKHPDNQRIRFLMELPTSFQIFSRDNNAGHLIKVASISSGNLKDVSADYAFPVMQHTTDSTSCGATPLIPAAAPPAVHPPTDHHDVKDFDATKLKEFYASEYTLYELLGMIVGVGFIMLAVMGTIIYLIYNNLVEKQEKESTGGSLDSVRVTRPSRAANKPKRTFRDTFRRNDSVRGSTHS